ncbi:hypothetical protein [Pseudoroseicyclus aestuarii]|uniref:Uncharacterized protein n=1 Tax=Pseudoroseicyclus aestuarii TaxID=1795041 RepID=A0A318SPX4_9RHOB|nr:hypothetical protein [Pseudoroseicyclus aestuarii]PYE83920.1 hypothetical protein DFP88_103281 [Pseudoroseicyclus aestuarii]
MAADLPELYFRLHPGGATVFRVAPDGAQRRLDLLPLAEVTLPGAAIRPLGAADLGAQDRLAIRAWIEARAEATPGPGGAPRQSAVTAINHAAHWAETKATDTDLEAASEELLLAMHDLRAVLLRKKTERLAATAPKADPPRD